MLDIKVDIKDIENNIVEVILESEYMALDKCTYYINLLEEEQLTINLTDMDYVEILNDNFVQYSFYYKLNKYGFNYTFSAIKVTEYYQDLSFDCSIATYPKNIENVKIDLDHSELDPNLNIPTNLYLSWDEDSNFGDNMLGYNIYYCLSPHNHNDFGEWKKLRGNYVTDEESDITLIPIYETNTWINLPILLNRPLDIKFSVVSITDEYQSKIVSEDIYFYPDIYGDIYFPTSPLSIKYGSYSDSNNQIKSLGTLLMPYFEITIDAMLSTQQQYVYCKKLNETIDILGWDYIYQYQIEVGKLKGNMEFKIYIPNSYATKYDVRNKDTMRSIPFTYNINDNMIRFIFNSSGTYIILAKHEIDTIDLDFHERTLKMIDRLPSWFKGKRKTIRSNIAYFLETIGLTLKEFETYLIYVAKQFYISTSDMNQIGNVYKYYLPQEYESSDIVNVSYGLRNFEKVNNIDEFYEDVFTSPEVPEIYPNKLIYIDQENKCLYARNIDGKETIIIDTIKEYQIVNKYKDNNPKWILHKIWNTIDEIGLLVDLNRYDWESNYDFAQRILDVFRFPSNATKEGLLNGISRDLCLKRTITWQNPKQDLILDESMITYNNIKVNGKPYLNVRLTHDNKVVLLSTNSFPPESKVTYTYGIDLNYNLTDYIDVIENKIPLKWDQFKWDIGYWDSVDINKKGSVIPSYYDASIKGFLKCES